MQERLAFNIGETFLGSGHFLLDFRNLGRLVSTLYSNVIAIAGLVLLLLIIYAGILMIGGSGDAQKQQQAQQVITWGILGFILVLAAYFIVRLIELSLGVGFLR